MFTSELAVTLREVVAISAGRTEHWAVVAERTGQLRRAECPVGREHILRSCQRRRAAR